MLLRLLRHVGYWVETENCALLQNLLFLLRAVVAVGASKRRLLTSFEQTSHSLVALVARVSARATTATLLLVLFITSVLLSVVYILVVSVYCCYLVSSQLVRQNWLLHNHVAFFCRGNTTACRLHSCIYNASYDWLRLLTGWWLALVFCLKHLFGMFVFL